jgi:hypothetical protein
MTVFVVSASGADFPLMKTRIVFVSASETLTSVKTPFWIPKPPPMEPTRSKSAMGFPSPVLSHISKKLEIPAGAKALAVLVNGSAFSFCSCPKFEGWKRSVTGFDYGRSCKQNEWDFSGECPNEKGKNI